MTGSALFSKYYQEEEEFAKNNKPEMVKIVPPVNSPVFNRSVLLQNISNVKDMTDTDLRKFIQYNFNNILSNIFTPGSEMTKYVKCFQDQRFLDAFIDVISTMQFFEKDSIVRCNTICYHYLTLSKEDRDPVIVDRMIHISRIINRTGLPRLLGLGLSDNLANILLIARYSDLDLNICVKRIDFIIITQPKELMSQEMITSIYKILFDVMREFSRIFQYFMLDVIPDYNEDDPTTYWVTEDVDEINSTMNLSVLEILDNLPSQIIRDTLINYAEGYSILGDNKPKRFSMQTLSDDYYRINNVIYMLSCNESIMVP